MIIINDLTNQSRLAFISGNTSSIGDIRKEVYKSWLRSKQANVNPYMTVLPRPDDTGALEIYNQDWEFNYHLPQVEPHIQDFNNYLSQTSAVLFCLDLDLNIVFQMGSEALLNELKSSNICIGANLSEKTVGTNAAALSRTYGHGICIVGAEHYIEAFRKYAGLGCIYLSDRETVKGYFMLMMPVDQFHPSQLIMLRNWSYLISNSLKLFKQKIESALGYEYLAFNAPKMEKGIIFVDYRGIILRMNDYLLKIKLCSEDNCGKKLNEVFPEIAFTLDSIKSGKSFQLQKVRFQGNKIFFIGCRPVIKEGTPVGIIITFRTNEQVRKEQMSSDSGHVRYNFDDLLGEHPIFIKTKESAKMAADTPSNILLSGESGTGKEMFAQAIHNHSGRAIRPFISVNCGAIPRELIASELFGYEKGAFTGARSEGAIGKFELANKGTIFLDEIGEMPLEMQTVLLRVLEERTINRVGGHRSIPIDVKIITATNKDLMELVKANKFRLDLYYRINVINIVIPPLRERISDINILIAHFREHFNDLFQRDVAGLTLSAMQLLMKYHWPGNVRELRNVIERCINQCSSMYLSENDLPQDILTACSQSQPQQYLNKTIIEDKTNLLTEFETAEKKQILDLMLKYNGNKSRVAGELGISRGTLYKKLKELQVV